MSSRSTSEYNSLTEDGDMSDTNSDYTSFVVLNQTSPSTPTNFHHHQFDQSAQRRLYNPPENRPFSHVDDQGFASQQFPEAFVHSTVHEGNNPFIREQMQQPNEQQKVHPVAPLYQASIANHTAPVQTQNEVINNSILIVGLSEQFGSEEHKVVADRIEIQQILYALNSSALINRILRYGEIKPDGTPRNIIVNLSSEDDRSYILENAEKLKSIAKWSNVSITIVPPPRHKPVSPFSNNHDEQTDRIFVIFGLDDQFGKEEDKKLADKFEVQQMLYSINCGAQIQNVRRAEKQGADNSPNSVIVELDSIEGRNFVLQNAEKIQSVHKWKNVKIKEINEPKQIVVPKTENEDLKEEIADLKKKLSMLLEMKDKTEERLQLATQEQHPRQAVQRKSFQPNDSTKFVPQGAPTTYYDNMPQHDELGFSGTNKQAPVVPNLSHGVPTKDMGHHPEILHPKIPLQQQQYQHGLSTPAQQIHQYNAQQAQLADPLLLSQGQPRQRSYDLQGSMPLSSQHQQQNYQQSTSPQQVPHYSDEHTHFENPLLQTKVQQSYSSFGAQTHMPPNMPTQQYQEQQYYQHHFPEKTPQYNNQQHFPAPPETFGQRHQQINASASSHYPPHETLFQPPSGQQHFPANAQQPDFLPQNIFEENDPQYNSSLQPEFMKTGQQKNEKQGIPLQPQPNLNNELLFREYKQQQLQRQQQEQNNQKPSNKQQQGELQTQRNLRYEKPANELHNAFVEKCTGPPKNLYILVLGQTGVGKSTWINGIANYMAFGTLDEAMAHGKPICLIPSQFTFYDTPDEPVVISLERSEEYDDDDKNEVIETGQSATQEPRTYQFKTSKYIINIIDTPGIGDVRGIEQDKENTRKILNTIGQYKELHAICFLFKNDETRLNDNFQFCISELLLQLHKDAIKNITFFFTHTAPLYEFGETFNTLEAFIKKIKKERNVEIPINEENMFCIDNEALNLVSANAQGITFVEQTHKRYANSWEKAAKETHRFIGFASRTRPHAINDTISINKSRTMIYYLAEPLAKVNEMIASNIEQVNAYKLVLQNTANNYAELEKKLTYTHIGIEIRQLDYPKTVCTDAHCTEIVPLPNTEQFQIHYKTICHEHCFLDNVEVEKVPDPNLQGCTAMGGTQNCQKCEHSWKSHMHIRYEQHKTSIVIEDKNTKEQMKKTGDVTAAKEKAIRECEAKIDEYEEEQNKIIEISLRFGGFLQANAILPYNDAFEKYVEQTIAEEEKCVRRGADRSKLEKLQALLAQYKQSKKMMDEAAKKSNTLKKNNITPTELEAMKRQLFNLKHSGDTLKNLFEATVKGVDNNKAGKTIKFSFKGDKASNKKQGKSRQH